MNWRSGLQLRDHDPAVQVELSCPPGGCGRPSRSIRSLASGRDLSLELGHQLGVCKVIRHNAGLPLP